MILWERRNIVDILDEVLYWIERKTKMIELLDIVNNKEDYFEYEFENAYAELKDMIEDL